MFAEGEGRYLKSNSAGVKYVILDKLNYMLCSFNGVELKLHCILV